MPPDFLRGFRIMIEKLLSDLLHKIK
jgi:hypothetical protein